MGFYGRKGSNNNFDMTYEHYRMGIDLEKIEADYLKSSSNDVSQQI